MKTDNLKGVVLFDIDGTLVTGPEDGPSAGVLAMIEATKAVAGRIGDFSPADFAGRTDVQIAKNLLEVSGCPNPPRKKIDALVKHYVHALGQLVSTAPYEVLGDPRSSVTVLEQAGYVVGLGTGNVKTGGAVKLKCAKIDDIFDIEKGGYGYDGDTRAQLLETGARRCDPGRTLPVIIVGDTPHDVTAAIEIGALCVGVPYRHNSANKLQEVGAHAIVEAVDQDLVTVIDRLISD